MAALITGCTIVRVYIGSEIRPDAHAQIFPGKTTKSQILDVFGPPDRIARQAEGDVFVYRFVRRNTDTFKIAEPVITNLELFTYSRVEEKDDRLIVLFDRDGLVESYGYRQGTRDIGVRQKEEGE
jgi:outer membrane protein assembly factor BamE (lipoprotein component of BamABCDE complex)